MELPDGQEHELAGPVQDDPAAAEHVPSVLLAVKTHQTAGALRWLERLCGTGTVTDVLQNGVEHEALVAPLAGRRLEWDTRNAVITRLGAHHAIPTPVSDGVTAQLAALDG